MQAAVVWRRCALQERFLSSHLLLSTKSGQSMQAVSWIYLDPLAVPARRRGAGVLSSLARNAQLLDAARQAVQSRAVLRFRRARARGVILAVVDLPVLRQIPLLSSSILFLLLVPVGVEGKLQKAERGVRVVSASAPSIAWSKAQKTRTRSLPLIPVVLPFELAADFSLLTACSWAVLASRRVFFQMAKVSAVTGVRFFPSLCRCRPEER